MDNFAKRIAASAEVQAAKYRYNTGPELMEAIQKALPGAKFDDYDLKDWEGPMPFTKVLVKKHHDKDEAALNKAGLRSYLIEPVSGAYIMLHLAQGEKKSW